MEKGHFKSFDNKPFKDGDTYYYFQDVSSPSASSADQEQAVPSVTLTDFELLQTVGKGGFGSTSLTPELF